MELPAAPKLEELLVRRVCRRLKHIFPVVRLWSRVRGVCVPGLEVAAGHEGRDKAHLVQVVVWISGQR
jgi:hypothetical protein